MMVKFGLMMKGLVDCVLFSFGEGFNVVKWEVGFYNFCFFVILDDDLMVFGKVIGDWDLGYGFISKMLVEVVIVLV